MNLKEIPMKAIQILATCFLGSILLACSFICIGILRQSPGSYPDKSTGYIEIPLADTTGLYTFASPNVESEIRRAEHVQGHEADLAKILPQYEYSFGIEATPNRLISSWYRYADGLRPAGPLRILLPETPDGKILTVSIRIVDDEGSILVSNTSNYIKTGHKIVNDNLKPRRGKESIIKRRPFFSRDNIMTAYIKVRYIRPNTFTEEAQLRINSWSSRRCYFVECILD